MKGKAGAEGGSAARTETSGLRGGSSGPAFRPSSTSFGEVIGLPSCGAGGGSAANCSLLSGSGAAGVGAEGLGFRGSGCPGGINSLTRVGLVLPAGVVRLPVGRAFGGMGRTECAGSFPALTRRGARGRGAGGSEAAPEVLFARRGVGTSVATSAFTRAARGLRAAGAGSRLGFVRATIDRVSASFSPRLAGACFGLAGTSDLEAGARSAGASTTGAFGNFVFETTELRLRVRDSLGIEPDASVGEEVLPSGGAV